MAQFGVLRHQALHYAAGSRFCSLVQKHAQVALILLFSLHFRDSSVLVEANYRQAFLGSSRPLIALFKPRIPACNCKSGGDRERSAPSKVCVGEESPELTKWRARSFKLLDVRAANSAVLSLPELKEPNKRLLCVSINASPLFILQGFFD